MKRIDLTMTVDRIIPIKPRTQAELVKMLRGEKYDTLLESVVSLLASYTGTSIDDAEKVVMLIERLKKHPNGEIADKDFSMIETALASASVEIKTTWKQMVEKLNKES